LDAEPENFISEETHSGISTFRPLDWERRTAGVTLDNDEGLHPMAFDYHSKLEDKDLLQDMYPLLIEEQTMLLGE
jgi:hypothetical protein